MGSNIALYHSMRSIMGQNEVTFWDRRSQNQVIRKQIMGQNKITFGDRRN
jgi:hypothetical protein